MYTHAICSFHYQTYEQQHLQHFDEQNQIQHVLYCCTFREKVLEKLYGCFQALSQHKFASNVVEVCLQKGNAQQRDRIVGEILQTGSNGSQDQLQVMMKDQFGNYVIQKVLEVRLLLALVEASLFKSGSTCITWTCLLIDQRPTCICGSQRIDTVMRACIHICVYRHVINNVTSGPSKIAQKAIF